MKYDFSTMPDRRGKDAIAWDSIGEPGAPAGPKEGFEAIPMWVADMNFATCPSIQDAIIRRCDKVVYVCPEKEEGAFLTRDRKLVDESGYCISYCNR